MHIEALHLKKIKNMRDMGGIPAENGKKIKHGKIIRSGRLSNLPYSTVNALKNLNIDNVIDMRTPTEIEEHTPTLIDGAEYHYFPLVTTATHEIINGKSMASIQYEQSKRIKKDFGNAENYMHEMYRILVFDLDSQEKLKKIFRLFIEEKNCILFHCNSGTDRTGIVAMLLESVLGVEKEIIIEDYMASRSIQFRRRTLQRILLVLGPVRICFKKLLFAMMLPKPQYIIDLMKDIELRYGTIKNYVQQVLDVSDEDIAILKENYLE